MGTSGLYSELDYLILAMVGTGVTSGYAMRKEMGKIRGGRWSAESGSVYRVLRRLERDGLLIQSGKVGIPNRERTEYELSVQGESLLHSWLCFPPDRAEFAYLIDPVRSRCMYLGRLKATEQVRVVKSWLQESKLLIVDLQREMNDLEDSDPFVRASHENVLMLAEARHEWLKRLLGGIRASQMPTHAVYSESSAAVDLERV